MIVDICMCALQVAHTFFDAPGAHAAIFSEDALLPQDKPYVTMVFCGPADYKVKTHATTCLHAT